MSKYAVITDPPRPYVLSDGSILDPWEDAAAIEADDADEAGEAYLDAHFSDMEYPKGPVELWMRGEDGVVLCVEVSIEYEPTFSASTVVHEHPRECNHYYRPGDPLCVVCRKPPVQVSP